MRKLDGYGILEIERIYFNKSKGGLWGEFTLIPVTFSNGTLKANSVLVEAKEFKVKLSKDNPNIELISKFNSLSDKVSVNPFASFLLLR